MAPKKECPRCHYRNKSTAKKCKKCGREINFGRLSWWVDINFPEKRYIKKIGPEYKSAK